MPFVAINNEIKNFKTFYKSCIMRGSEIANCTNERDIILISKKTSFKQIEFFIGAILYNRIPVMIPHPSIKVFHKEFADKMKKIDSVTKPSLCISDWCDVDLFSEFWKTAHSFPESGVKSNNFDFKKNDVAFIQLSSGTTGLPKVINISHSAVIEQCHEYSNKLNLKSKDVIVSWLPLYHDMGLIACFMMPLLQKISFIHINPFEWLSNPEILFKNIEKYKGTHVWMPNFAFSYMSKRCKKSHCDLSSVSSWISCSEMTHKPDMLSFLSSFKDNGVTEDSLQVCYALAENVFAVSHSKLLKTTHYEKENIVSCGEFIPGTSVIIKNNKNELIMSDKKAGNIFIRSSYMPIGLDFDEFGYYKTGDVGFIKNNNLYVLGRSDDIINSYGNNIFPYEIEKMVSNMDGIIPGRVACFGVYNKQSGTQDIYLVAESAIENKKGLKKKILEKILKKFEFRVKCSITKNGYIVKTSSGKINRKKTREKLLNDKRNC